MSKARPRDSPPQSRVYLSSLPSQSPRQTQQPRPQPSTPSKLLFPLCFAMETSFPSLLRLESPTPPLLIARESPPISSLNSFLSLIAAKSLSYSTSLAQTKSQRPLPSPSRVRLTPTPPLLSLALLPLPLSSPLLSLLEDLISLSSREVWSWLCATHLVRLVQSVSLRLALLASPTTSNRPASV